MELEHLGGGGAKPEKGNPRLYKIALALCVCLCAVLLLALILGKSTTTTHTHMHIYKKKNKCNPSLVYSLQGICEKSTVQDLHSSQNYSICRM